MLNRRRFLKGVVVAAASSAMPRALRANNAVVGALVPDPDHLLDLPAGFAYQIVSRAGDRMNDGMRVPGAHDGMAAFAGADGRVILVCNHENTPSIIDRSAFGDSFAALPNAVKSKFYDAGGGLTPGAGGTTTTVFDPRSGATEHQHLSLAGTEINCAGGSTPWGSWLSCEECFQQPGKRPSGGLMVTREKPHGYVFEVAADTAGLVEPKPLKAMGRFVHEAAAVHESSGTVYLSEDMFGSLLYRFLPASPGQLAEGGRLQALAVTGQPSLVTNNWDGEARIRTDHILPTHWIDLDDVDGEKDDLRFRGATKGAATFARGEGLCVAGDEIVFTCTEGGAAGLGQVFAYRPSPHEGTALEEDLPGQLRLICESTRTSLLRNGDNLIQAPWGDLLICEDAGSHCSIVGVRADGGQYQLVDNAYTASELAGVCFSPDGKILFVNIQWPGLTLAITGPWPE